ncbi:TonB-dependent receptor plug domain-containing protein [Janthinobacterium agaricidamnosum]|uniref:TonB-dependent Receptor Plug domain protein n=1 Tax=Janthinobacterium agaricidamnosum NBRC 102515 = DSM 9628 TaxID=1349767 RepID=W0V8A5_9BURK|nr:TonB-dependent receptor [Janthinobacterium agaricidamnosum]CDG85049.1 tonB-dependent Receptor Plug domain protein [Janthinobacterium agaricidamnosum NBRC 102515 = DSM 9628]
MNSNVSRHAALTSLALAIAAPAAFAQTTGNVPGTVIVTATRTPQKSSELLAETEVITSEEIARSGAGSLTELLQKQRGIEVARNGGPGTSSSVFIRGANSNQNIVLVDGVRIGSSTTGAANWSPVPLANIDHIEIVYGPLSTMYGSDAIGGVIQIFTKKGSGAPAVGASLGFGSDATRQYDASVSGATEGYNSLSYSLNVSKEKSDGFSATKPGNFSYNPDKDGYDKKSVTGQLGFKLAKGHDLGLTIFQSKLDAQYDNGLGDDARSNQKLQNVGFYLNDQFLPFWHSNVQVAEARDEANDNSINGPGSTSFLGTKQSTFDWQNDFAIGQDNLQLLGSYRKEDVTSSDDSVLNRGRSTKSLAASYTLKRGQHLVSASLRRDWIAKTNLDKQSETDKPATGSIGYGYQISSALRANASFGTSFRQPTFNELYYPGYGIASNRPEKGRNSEVGLRYDDGTSQLSAVYYHNRITDLLVYASTCPVEVSSPPYGCAYNVNNALLEGVTLSARRQFGDFGFSGNTDFQNPRDLSTDKLLARRSRKHANVAVDYSLGALKTGVELQLSGQRFDDGANKNALGGYGLLNLFATYQFAPDWSLLARWNNATDKQYELARNYNTAGATFFLGLRYGFK